jgi:hypothetical protein
MAGERQLSDGNDAGTILGQSTSDLIAFHGSAPVDQYTTITLATSSTIATVVARVQSILAALREKGLIAT